MLHVFQKLKKKLFVCAKIDYRHAKFSSNCIVGLVTMRTFYATYILTYTANIISVCILCPDFENMLTNKHIIHL